MRTPVKLSGKDENAMPIRKRVCEDCGTTFVTGESVILATKGAHRLVKFSEVDDTHQRSASEDKRNRNGWTKKGQKRRPLAVYGRLFINK